MNKEIRRYRRWVAADVNGDALQRLVNLNSGLRPKLSCLVSVFGLSKWLMQKLKWPTVPLDGQSLNLCTKRSS